MPRFLLSIVLVCLLVLPVSPVRAQYEMDIGSLMAAIRHGDLSAEVEPMDSATTIYVTRISRLAGIRINSDRMTRTIAFREPDLRRFRRAIGNVRLVKRMLEIHGHTLDQVIWATHSGGSAMLYVDDR